jgi:hypothetical protein
MAFHELTETLTNPRLDGCAGPETPLSEIADKCSLWGDKFSPPGVSPFYATSQLYSNLVGGCVTTSPYYPLQFDDRDSRRTNAGGEWASNQYKAQCSDDAAIAGISATTPSLRAHSVLCSRTVAPLGGSTRVLVFASGDNRADTTTGDWHPGFYKAECAHDEVISGLAQTTASNHEVTVVRCVKGVAPAAVQALTFSTSSDNRAGARNGDWAPGFVKTECQPGFRLKGISKDTQTGAIAGILCTYGAYNN